MTLPEAILKYSGIKNKPFVLAKPLKVTLSNGCPMYIFEGYWTDFASIPVLLKIFIDYIGKENVAFIIHDYLYNFGGYKSNGRTKSYTTFTVSRKFADDEMKYQMNLYGASKARQLIFWVAVRLFGWLHFGKI